MFDNLFLFICYQAMSTRTEESRYDDLFLFLRYKALSANDIKKFDHLFPGLLRLQVQPLHLPPSSNFSAKPLLVFSNKLSRLSLSKYRKEKRQKLGLQKLGNAVVTGKLFTDCIVRESGGLIYLSRILFTTQRSTRASPPRTLSSRPGT